MIELAHPWLLLVGLLPFFMWLLPAFRQTRESVRVPFFERLMRLSGERLAEGSVVVERRQRSGEM